MDVGVGSPAALEGEDERHLLCGHLLAQSKRLNTMPLAELEEMESTLWTFLAWGWVDDEVLQVCTQAIAERRAAITARPLATDPGDDIDAEIATLRAEKRKLLRAKLRGVPDGEAWPCQPARRLRHFGSSGVVGRHNEQPP